MVGEFIGDILDRLGLVGDFFLKLCGGGLGGVIFDLILVFNFLIEMGIGGMNFLFLKGLIGFFFGLDIWSILKLIWL